MWASRFFDDGLPHLNNRSKIVHRTSILDFFKEKQLELFSRLLK